MLRTKNSVFGKGGNYSDSLACPQVKNALKWIFYYIDRGIGVKFA